MSGGTRPDSEAVLEHLPHLKRRARALTSAHADAEDLVQDTLERALRSLPRLRPGSNVRGWLNTLMEHRFIDRWRVNRHTRAFGFLAEVPAPEPEPRPAWLEIGSDDIHAGIAQLPPAAAAILRLRLGGRMSYAEIARRLGTSSDTVGTRLFRARRRLQEVLIARHLQPAAGGRAAAITPLRPPARRRRASGGAVAANARRRRSAASERAA